jgi:transposase, IS5 family
MLEAGLLEHREQVGRVPELVAADSSFASPATETRLPELGVKRLAIPSRAKQKRKAQKTCRWFRRAWRWRAGIEADISLLKRGFELARAQVRGLKPVHSWVGWGIFSQNLWRVARLLEPSAAPG